MGLTNDTIAICLSVGGAAVAMLGAVWKVAAKTQKVLDKIMTVERESYTLPRAAEVALRTAIENPTMRVPDPREPRRIIKVSPAE